MSVRVTGLTVFRQQIVCSPNDEFGHQPAKLFEFDITLQLVLFRCISISTFEDLGFKVLLEIELGTEVFGVGEIEKSKVFR
jgi:hypothetical protein